jgi:hypothetical protein
VTAEQLEAHGAELCQRPVMSLFDSNTAVKQALESGSEPHITCADWEQTGWCAWVGHGVEVRGGA